MMGYKNVMTERFIAEPTNLIIRQDSSESKKKLNSH